MTRIGLIHVVSAVYLSLAICVAISMNEHRLASRIVRETARRWLKFLGLSALIALVVWLIG